jgi:hypothetical protein
MTQLFQVTPKGDGKMNLMHIMACITTHADGK